MEEEKIAYEIGEYNKETRSVPVTFAYDGVTHKRDVNACHTEAGEYDADATSARVAEVASGVKHKISVGAITNAPEAPSE